MTARASVGLLDTDTFILRGRLDPSWPLPEESVLSAISLAELSVGPLVVSTEEERDSRQAHVQQAEADVQVIPFDESAARAFGRVAASLRRAGRKADARTFDAMIAAVAIANGLPLYTCNPEDFVGIDELQLVRVPHPDDQEDKSDA